MTQATTEVIERSSASTPSVLRSSATVPASIQAGATVSPAVSSAASTTPVLRAVSTNGVGHLVTAPSRITVEASETISALKPVVVIDGLAAIARSGDASHRGFVAGISSNAATQGNDVTIRTEGEMTDSSWSWDTSKPWIFYGDGVLTQAPPESWCQPIARVQSATTIFVSIQGGIER